MHRAGLAFASMSQNNITILYAGIDVAKSTLQLSLRVAPTVSHNDAKKPRPHSQAARRSRDSAARQQGPRHPRSHRRLRGGAVAALPRRAPSVIQPSRARHFAGAKSEHAKTDAIDADVLPAFGEAIAPAPTPPPSAAQSHLERSSVGARNSWTPAPPSSIAPRTTATKCCAGQSRGLLAVLDRQIAECERAIAAEIAADESFQARAVRLQQVQGIGPIVAATLQAHLPELGTLSDGEAAGLAGLAPYNRDSGPWKGTRRIRGGRAPVRCALYMAALSAVRHDRILREFYTRLCQAGKKPLVALTAAMRKLVVLLNRMLKKPAFTLAG